MSVSRMPARRFGVCALLVCLTIAAITLGGCKKSSSTSGSGETVDVGKKAEAMQKLGVQKGWMSKGGTDGKGIPAKGQ